LFDVIEAARVAPKPKEGFVRTLQELADSYDRSISTMRRATRAPHPVIF
jgi:hypothetical protein